MILLLILLVMTICAFAYGMLISGPVCAFFIGNLFWISVVGSGLWDIGAEQLRKSEVEYNVVLVEV